MEENKQYKRRVRYSGTHPKKYSEKYKEHNPTKYKETIDHVISKGITPAGMHISIMVDEILEVLKIQPGDIGLDATLGYGGHSCKMLECLQGKGHLYSLDIDSVEIENTRKRLEDKGYKEDILTIEHINFRNIDKVLPEGVKLDFLMADLGVSSMQIDNPERGFSFKNDGPLDLRLNPNEGVPASSRLMELSCDEIEGMLIENSDEPYAKEIAVAITKHKDKGIHTTKELYTIIKEALSFLKEVDRDEKIKKSTQRTMQAIRIDVNSEFEALYEFLEKLPLVMKSGGRIAILTFHSGEDRLVKKAFKEYYRLGVFKEISREVTRPSMEECFKNPRAKSTKMRYAIVN